MEKKYAEFTAEELEERRVALQIAIHELQIQVALYEVEMQKTDLEQFKRSMQEAGKISREEQAVPQEPVQ